MMRAVEMGCCLTVATAVHLAVFLGVPAGGPSAGGTGGDAEISLTAADASVARMVAEWEAPPEVQTLIETPPDAVAEPPAPEIAAPEPPAPEMPAAPEATTVPEGPALPRMAKAERLPFVDPVPPPVHAPKTSARPEARPKDRRKTDAPVRAAPSEPSPAQQAAGSGGGQAAGQHGGGVAASATSGGAVSAMRDWQARIRTRIERRKRYPDGSHHEGQAVVRMTVGRNGALQGLRLMQSSGSAALDGAALNAVRRAGGFPAAPEQVAGATFDFDLPISFRR